MKSLIRYAEFGPNMGLKSMKEFFEPQPYEGMQSIIDYLKNGKKTYAKAARANDVFTGEAIDVDEYVGMTDGEYSWNSVLSYYVEKYNLRLPKDFEAKVLNN